MSGIFAKGIMGLGLILLAHSAYSAHHCMYLYCCDVLLIVYLCYCLVDKTMVNDANYWPAKDAVIESILACVLILLSLTLNLKLSPVRLTSEMNKQYEEIMTRMDFVNLNNRGNSKTSLLNKRCLVEQ